MPKRKHTPAYPAARREHGVRFFREQRSEYARDTACCRAIAPKLGCSPDSLRVWCQQAERDRGQRNGLTSEEKDRIKYLERDVKERRLANESSLKITKWPTGSRRSAGGCRLPLLPSMLRQPIPVDQYTERLADAGIDPSVRSVGDSYDNALAESTIGQFKTEVIDVMGPWKAVGQVEWETCKWVNCDNTKRLHSKIRYITPQEAEENFYETLNTAEKAA